MKPRNLQTMIAYRDQDLMIDLGKQFDGELRASMARGYSPKDTETKQFEIIENQYLKLPKAEAGDEYDDYGVLLNSILGRWYFDVRQIFEDKDEIIYTGTIFFNGNITK